MKSPRLVLLQALAVCALATPHCAHACAACFGKSDSPMAQGMNMGIFTLLLVVVSVLLGIAGFFFYIIRRASRMAAASLTSTDAAAPAAAMSSRTTAPASAPDAATLPQLTQ